MYRYNGIRNTSSTINIVTENDHRYVCTASLGVMIPSMHLERITMRLPIFDNMSRVNSIFPKCALIDTK